MLSVSEAMRRACRLGLVIPAFNTPYLPMIQPVVAAVADQDSFAMIETARIEWYKFPVGSLGAVAGEFARWARPDYVRLHLDHVPVVDENGARVDYLPFFHDALARGYESVMIDGSRLPLAENIYHTRTIADLAHAAGAAVEAELGAIMGHEEQPEMTYDELYQSGRGFTDPAEAKTFAEQSGCDWLSVAIGNIHGSVHAGRKDLKKVETRLNLEHLARLAEAAGIPLVLHGGSGIQHDHIRGAVRHGIAKINVATEIRQPYEVVLRDTGSVSQAQQAVYERTVWVLREFLQISGSRARLEAQA